MASSDTSSPFLLAWGVRCTGAAANSHYVPAGLSDADRLDNPDCPNQGSACDTNVSCMRMDEDVLVDEAHVALG
jgi:hypothetical protein